MLSCIILNLLCNLRNYKYFNNFSKFILLTGLICYRVSKTLVFLGIASVKFCGSSRLLVSRVSSWSPVSRDWVLGDASGALSSPLPSGVCMAPSLGAEAETLPFSLSAISDTGSQGDPLLALGSLARYFFPLLSGMAAKFLVPKN